MTAVVVGAGIAGCACALFLRRGGHDVQLLEALPCPVGEEAGALLIAPEGVRVLARLGLADAVAHSGIAVRRMQLEDEHGAALMRMAIGRRRLPAALLVARSALLRELLAAVAAAGIPLRYQACLSAIRQTAQGVRVVLEDGATLGGDFLVGADGLDSGVRRALFPDVPAPRPTGLATVGGFAAYFPPRADPHALHLIFSARGFFAYVALNAAARRRAAWWCTLPLSGGELLRQDSEALRGWLLSLSPLPGPLPQLLEHSPQLVSTPLFDLDPPLLWSSQRAVLIGDAAHAMPPHSGHGASLALEDAEFLAASLAHCADLASAFAHFQTRRWRRIARLREQCAPHGRAARAAVARRQRIPRLLMQVTTPRLAAAQNRSFWYRGPQEK